MLKGRPYLAVNLLAIATMLCMVADAGAAATPIGTASALGDMRVDGYKITGNATLFDGTSIETDNASAALRLDKGGEIRLSDHARGTLYQDRFVLQQGSGQWTRPGSFPMELNGLLVTPSGPSSRGVVSMRAGNTAEVAAITGELRVTNGSGLLVAGVLPGSDYSFTPPQTGAAAAPATPGSVPMSLYGTLTKVDGRYYLELPSPDLGVVYELKGSNLEKLVGKQIRVKGTATLNPTLAAGGGMHVIAVTASSIIIPAGAPLLGTVALVSTITVAAAATAVGVFEVVQALTPASR